MMHKTMILSASLVVLVASCAEDPVSSAYFDSSIPWVQTSAPDGGNVYCFERSDCCLFAGTAEGGVFRSTDDGASWEKINTGLTSNFVPSLLVIGTFVYAGTGDGVFLSTSYGASWTPALSIGNISSLAMTSDGILAGTRDFGMWLSSSSGGWNPINEGLTNTNITSIGLSSAYVFAGTGGGGVFRSGNGGTTWTLFSTGLTEDVVYDLAASPTNLYAIVNGDAFTVSIMGTIWTDITGGLSVAFSDLAVSGEIVFAATNDGVFLSVTNGEWVSIGTGLTTTIATSIAAIDSSLFVGMVDGSIWRHPL